MVDYVYHTQLYLGQSIDYWTYEYSRLAQLSSLLLHDKLLTLGIAAFHLLQFVGFLKCARTSPCPLTFRKRVRFLSQLVNGLYFCQQCDPYYEIGKAQANRLIHISYCLLYPTRSVLRLYGRCEYRSIHISIQDRLLCCADKNLIV